MGIIDILIVIALLPSIYFGFKNGFIKQVIALAVIILGIILSLRFSDVVSQWLMTLITVNESGVVWVKIASFILIFVAVAIILNLLGTLLEKIIHITLLGALNRLLGFVFSFLKFAFVVALIIYFVDSINQLTHFIPQEKIDESLFYTPLLTAIKSIFPYLNSLL